MVLRDKENKDGCCHSRTLEGKKGPEAGELYGRLANCECSTLGTQALTRRWDSLGLAWDGLGRS